MKKTVVMDPEVGEMVKFEIYEADALFWKQGGELFCRIAPTIYCCGRRDLPETEDDMNAALESAWIW